MIFYVIQFYKMEYVMKENNNFSLTIGERLTLAKQSYKIIKSKKCTINKLRR